MSFKLFYYLILPHFRNTLDYIQVNVKEIINVKERFYSCQNLKIYY